MSTYRSMLKIRAFELGRAQPYRQKRHLHISEKPFVIAYVQMAGETFSLWGALVGRDRDNPQWIFTPDPRNRDGQSEVFAQLSSNFIESSRRAFSTEDEPLQVWVTNTTAAANLARLSRVMRARQVSEDVSYAGAVLDLYAQAASAPGSALCVPATKALSDLRVTGQSAFEDANLATQIAWWDQVPLSRISASDFGEKVGEQNIFELTRRAEQLPMGTLTNPRVDEQILFPLLSTYHRLRSDDQPIEASIGKLSNALLAQVEPMWHSIWEAHKLASNTPQSLGASQRWADDARLYGWQIGWLDQGKPRRFVDTPMRAAKLLSQWEAKHTGMLRNVVLEDDLGLVEAILDGKAFVGQVTLVETRKPRPRIVHPFITLETATLDVIEGTQVWLRSNPSVTGLVTSISEKGDSMKIEIEVTGGFRNTLMPTAGSKVAFILLEPPFPVQPKPPKDTPWTHVAKSSETETLESAGTFND